MAANNPVHHNRDTLLAQAADQRAQLVLLLPQMVGSLKSVRRSLTVAHTIIRSPILVTATLLVSGWLMNRLFSVGKRVAGPLALMGMLPKLIELLLRPKSAKAATAPAVTPPAASP